MSKISHNFLSSYPYHLNSLIITVITTFLIFQRNIEVKASIILRVPKDLKFVLNLHFVFINSYEFRNSLLVHRNN